MRTKVGALLEAQADRWSAYRGVCGGAGGADEVDIPRAGTAPRKKEGRISPTFLASVSTIVAGTSEDNDANAMDYAVCRLAAASLPERRSVSVSKLTFWLH